MDLGKDGKPFLVIFKVNFDFAIGMGKGSRLDLVARDDKGILDLLYFYLLKFFHHTTFLHCNVYIPWPDHLSQNSLKLYNEIVEFNLKDIS